MTGLPVWGGFPPSYRRSKSADQAAFNTVEAAITGFAFPISANEEWDLDITLAVTLTGTGGVKFYFTVPAGAIGDSIILANVAAVGAFQTLPMAVLTVPGTFLVTAAITGLYKMTCRVLAGATPGNVQLVGICGAASTCVVKRGSLFRAVRIVP